MQDDWTVRTRLGPGSETMEGRMGQEIGPGWRKPPTGADVAAREAAGGGERTSAPNPFEEAEVGTVDQAASGGRSHSLSAAVRLHDGAADDVAVNPAAPRPTRTGGFLSRPAPPGGRRVWGQDDPDGTTGWNGRWPAGRGEREEAGVERAAGRDHGKGSNADRRAGSLGQWTGPEGLASAWGSAGLDLSSRTRR